MNSRRAYMIYLFFLMSLMFGVILIIILSRDSQWVIMEQELTQALDRKDVQGTVTGFHKVSQPWHRLGCALGEENTIFNIKY